MVGRIDNETAPSWNNSPPVTGTVALEGTVDQTYKAANAVIVKTVDGVRHLFHLTGKTAVHGSESAGAETLRRLKAGSTIVVHYTAAAGEQTALETLRLTERGAIEAGNDVDRAAVDTTTVVVYYADEAGQRVAHYFKKIA